MGIRNKRPDLNGLLVISKPLGWTSADVCRLIRRRTGGAKVGHAGTLDPLATGVLVVCLGRATKTIDALMATQKVYLATIDLSAFSTTDDAEGERTPIATDAQPPTIEQIKDVLVKQFTGDISQCPPAYSAVKIDGQRAYRLARAGKKVQPKPKRVMIHSIDVCRYDWPALELDITCGKGTYIRSIARDLGTALGTGGMLAALSRTRVGPFTLADAIEVDALPEKIEADSLRSLPTDQTGASGPYTGTSAQPSAPRTPHHESNET